MELTRSQAAGRRRAAAKELKKARKRGEISVGDCLRARAFLRRNPQEADEVLDDICELAADEGYALPASDEHGEMDWEEFFAGLTEFAKAILEALPGLIGICAV